MPTGPGGKPIPPGQLSVAWHAGISAYVMVYSPWPGWSDAVHIRIADNPWGPWSKPTSLPLSGCADVVGGRTYNCYTANRQVLMDAPGVLGVGYYDSRIDPDEGPSGAFVVAGVPIELDRRVADRDRD